MAAPAQPETNALQPLKLCRSYELIPPDMSDQGMEPEDPGLTMTVKSKRTHLNLVLCGRRGSGKTSAAEVILGHSELHPASRSSECVRNQGEVCGRWVSLVELPALSGKPQQEVMEESLRCISLCGPEGVHAFILVLPVGPLTDEDKGELQSIQDTFSSRVNDFTMILFTVDSDPTAPAVVDFIKENKDLQELIQICGGRYVVFNVKDKQQIPELLESVEKMSVELSRCFSTSMFTRAYTEKTSKLQAELQDVKQRSETGSELIEGLKTERLKEIEEMKRKEEDSKKKHREDLKTLRAQTEQERKDNIQKLREKDENIEKEREKRKKEHEEEEKKRRKQEEAQRQEWKLKLEASERKFQLEREQRENTEKKLDQCRRERKRDRDVWDKEKDQIWERMHQDLKQNLEEVKKNLQEEKRNHKKLQEEYYQKRRKWSYVWFTLLLSVIFILFYVYQSQVQTTQRDL